MNWTDDEYAAHIARKAAQKGREGGRPAEVLEMTPPDAAPRRAHSREEHVEQTGFFCWVADMALTNADYLHIAAIGNENVAGAKVGGYRKEEGVKAGYEDIVIDLARGGYMGARLETKKRIGGTVSDNQKVWHVRHRRAGYYVEVCEGYEALQEATAWYMSLPPTQGQARGTEQ